MNHFRRACKTFLSLLLLSFPAGALADTPPYAVGGIPCETGTTPTGGFTVSIPISTLSCPGTLSEDNQQATLTYDASHDRVRMAAYADSNLILIRYYIGRDYLGSIDNGHHRTSVSDPIKKEAAHADSLPSLPQ